ncbi:alpha/beta fold hydrolase [Nonomuraea sp. NPDC049400]|uniref:alpha/beta fold hydrolase n=1 Tax=Nonomuraea sp. NPDC049400 TaxID=3364352 RepID=UPI0037B5A3C0
MPTSPLPTITDPAAVSADQTRIGYRTVGTGPNLVLVQGAMGTCENFTELAGLLSGSFTVILPDRRGRGLSPRPFEPGYQAARDIEDLAAVLNATGATDIFGLSTGALLALEAARTLPNIRRVAAFEPPIYLDGLPTELIARFHRETIRDDLPAMLITAMKLTGLAPRPVELIPRLLLEAAMRLVLRREARGKPGRYASTAELARALPYDIAVVEQLQDITHYSAIDAEVLLLGAEQSPPYMRAALDTLANTLPTAERIELAGVGHGAAWNTDRSGNPHTVAPALRRFFTPAQPN